MPKDLHTIIDHLSPNDALVILRSLARDDASLAARIAEVATAHLSQADAEQVAMDLYDDLDALDVEEV